VYIYDVYFKISDNVLRQNLWRTGNVLFEKPGLGIFEQLEVYKYNSNPKPICNAPISPGKKPEPEAREATATGSDRRDLAMRFLSRGAGNRICRQEWSIRYKNRFEECTSLLVTAMVDRGEVRQYKALEYGIPLVCSKIILIARFWMLSICSANLLWSPYGIRQTTIFLPCDFYLLLFSSPNLSGRRLDVYHSSTHGVALVRI